MNQVFEALHFFFILFGIFAVCGVAAAIYLWLEQFTVPYTSHQRTLANLKRATPAHYGE